MIKIDRNSDELIIVVHEIYGINQHMVDICGLLAAQNFDVLCPNLLENDFPYDYSQEYEAYLNFMNHVGFTNGLDKLKRILVDIRDKYSKIFILGFSVGATIAWLCSDEESVDGVVGYYGSRIRNFVHINPTCPTLLFFPKEEKSFNVNELVLNLDKPAITMHLYAAEHGFSDPYGANYNDELTRNTFKETLEFFKGHSF